MEPARVGQGRPGAARLWRGCAQSSQESIAGACSGANRPAWTGRDGVGEANRDPSGSGLAGKVSSGRREAREGRARQAWHSMAAARRGLASARNDLSWLGEAGQERSRLGLAGSGRIRKELAMDGHA